MRSIERGAHVDLPGAPASSLTGDYIRGLLASKLAHVVSVHKTGGDETGPQVGKNALKMRRSKLFALFTQGILVVKLPKVHVGSLVAAGIGKPFDPGHGRIMKEWLTVTSPKAS